MSDKQDTGINTNPEQGPAFASRRTVIKGLASAVPVVMTIGCGQAMANASNHQCIVNTEQPDKKTVLECIEGSDDWARKPGTGDNAGKQCLVYVNEEGLPGNGKQYAVTASCYTSFAIP